MGGQDSMQLDNIRFEEIYALRPDARCRFRWWSPRAYWYLGLAMVRGYRPWAGRKWFRS